MLVLLDETAIMTAATAMDWPQEITADEGTIVVCQPQPEKLRIPWVKPPILREIKGLITGIGICVQQIAARVPKVVASSGGLRCGIDCCILASVWA
jgi:hypothetical protein